MSADGNIDIVGGGLDSGGDGAAWVWRRLGGVWTQYASKLVSTGAAGAAGQGYSVSLSAGGDRVLVGGPTDRNIVRAAWVFT